MKSVVQIILCCMAMTAVFSQDKVKRVGNEIKASQSGPDWPKTVFLLHDTALAEGIVFAFSAYFRNIKKVHFQIWRRASASSTRNNFTLVREWPIIPGTDKGKEDIYLHTRQNLTCFRVSKDDRLGIYFEEAPGSVAYTFQSDNTQTFQYIVKNGTAPQTGSSVVFDTLVYPYMFSAAAYIDTDMSKYTVKANGTVTCPKTLTIPMESPSTPDGGIGATGAPGPRGEEGATGPQGVAGSKGATGERGEQGLMGKLGEGGATGPQGATGLQGPKGEHGFVGATGMQGLAGPPGPSGKDTNTGPNAMESLLSACTWCKDLLNPYLILGLIIWLTLVTILLVTLVCCITCRRKNKNKYDERWSSSQKDLWKKYEATNGSAAEVPSYENPAMDPSYDAVQEGRTAF